MQCSFCRFHICACRYWCAAVSWRDMFQVRFIMIISYFPIYSIFFSQLYFNTHSILLSCYWFIYRCLINLVVFTNNSLSLYYDICLVIEQFYSAFSYILNNYSLSFLKIIGLIRKPFLFGWHFSKIVQNNVM